MKGLKQDLEAQLDINPKFVSDPPWGPVSPDLYWIDSWDIKVKPVARFLQGQAIKNYLIHTLGQTQAVVGDPQHLKLGKGRVRPMQLPALAASLLCKTCKHSPTWASLQMTQSPGSSKYKTRCKLLMHSNMYRFKALTSTQASDEGNYVCC